MVALVLQVLAAALGGVVLYKVFKTLTRGKYRCPPRLTLKGKIYNWMLWPEMIMKRKNHFKKITIENVEKEAIKRAKLTDFGDSWYKVGFQAVIDLINKRKMTPLGQYVAFDSFMRRLVARLRVKEELKKNPEALETPLVPPVFILGVPRTGTTFLHRLLSLDPTRRYPKTYELYDPATRYPDDPVKDAKVRRKYVQKGIDEIKEIVPHIEAMHELGADEPEECLISISMDHPWIPCAFHLFGKDLTQMTQFDLKAAYSNHMQVLQLLAYQQNTQEKPWVLKCPGHLGFIKTIKEVFPPGTSVIWTHRDPCESLPSCASLFQTFQEMHEAEDAKLDELGQDTIKFWQAMLRKADHDLSTVQIPHSHVRYEKLIKDPVAVVKDIYSSMGWEYTDEYDKILGDYIAENKAKRSKIKGKSKKLHNYSMEMYAMSKEQVDTELGWYINKYLS